VTVEVRASNNALLHPRGAVGVVTRTPAGAELLYSVHFPDGSDASFTAGQMEALSHFKEHLVDGLAEPKNFDLESFVIFRCVTGSRAYGLDTEESDTDRRGIYLAPPEMNASLYGAPEQFEDNAGQSCIWELQRFLLLALKANPNILECLYSPIVEKITPLGEELVALRSHFLSRAIFQTFSGYALGQFGRIEQDVQTRGKVRWKNAMHLLRLLLTGAATLREGAVPVRIEQHRERLLAVKQGALSWAEVAAWRKELHRDFERALVETRLPERPDFETVNRFLLHARRCGGS
jgi:predicted nucleotidyltransferase